MIEFDPAQFTPRQLEIYKEKIQSAARNTREEFALKASGVFFLVFLVVFLFSFQYLSIIKSALVSTVFGLSACWHFYDSYYEQIKNKNINLSGQVSACDACSAPFAMEYLTGQRKKLAVVPRSSQSTSMGEERIGGINRHYQEITTTSWSEEHWEYSSSEECVICGHQHQYESEGTIKANVQSSSVKQFIPS